MPNAASKRAARAAHSPLARRGGLEALQLAWTTDGAVQVADLVIVPVPPGRRELAATAAMLAEHERFPTLLVPTIVPPTPPAAWITALQQFAEPEWVHLAPAISEHRWLRRRMLTSAVTRQRNPGARTAAATSAPAAELPTLEEANPDTLP